VVPRPTHRQAPQQKSSQGQFAGGHESPTVWDLVDQDDPWKLCATGFRFTEARFGDKGGSLVQRRDQTRGAEFTRMAAGEVLRIGDPAGATFTPAHRLIETARVCCVRMIAVTTRGKYEVRADSYDARSSHSPNDVV